MNIKIKKLSFLCFTICFSATLAFAQTKNVDNFTLGENRIAVYFYDPIPRIQKLDKDFGTRSDKEKSELLDKYLHENPLYLFQSTNKKTGKVTYFCIRGNPEKTKTKMFYKVEVITGVPGDFDPNATSYSDKIVKVIDQVNCGGTLFENMAIFDSEAGKKLVGNGIQVYGYFRRVQPFSEIKASMIDIIKSFQEN